MKKQLLTLTILSVVVFKAYSQSPYDTLTFEKHASIVVIDTPLTSNVWQIGTPHKTFFDSAYSRPYAIVTDTVNPYPANNVSAFQFIIPSKYGSPWTNCSVPVISFWTKYDMDSLKDGGFIYLSGDKGKTWQNVYYYSYSYRPPFTIVKGDSAVVTGHSNGWQYLNFHFEWAFTPYPGFNYLNGDTILMKFVFRSDSIYSGKEGWMIDNIYFSFDVCEGIDEHYGNPEQISIYPNPASSQTEILYQLPTGENTSVLKLYNEVGQLVSSQNISSAKGTMNEDVSALPNGIYYYTLSVNGVVEATNKLVIIH